MDIVFVIFPVFAIAVVGYLVTWAGIFRLDDIGGLTRYVFNIALPVMLFDSMSKVSLPETIRWSFMLAYYVPTLIVFVVGARLGKRLFRYRRTEQGIYGMGCAYSNTVLIGLPIVSTAWGDTAVLPLMMIIAVHSAILFSLTTAVAESGQHGGDRRSRTKGEVVLRTVAGMVKNPIFGGLVLGLLFNVTALSIPDPLQTVLSWLRGSALPAALFVTGASLRRFRVMGQVGPAGVMLLMKLLVHPLLVWVAATLLFDLPPLWKGVAVITASLPTGINATVFAGKYDAAMAPVATTTLLSTAISVITLSVLLIRLMPV
jgi:malonate transporter and related proteins